MNHRIIFGLLAATLSFSMPAMGQNFSIDFSTDEPNQIIAAPDGISITAVEVSAGSITYGSFSTTFDGVPFAASSGGWMESVDPLEAKHFFFTIAADPGSMFSIDGVSGLVRSTGAGPSGAALIIDGDVVDSISTPDDSAILSIAGAATGAFTTVTIRFAGFDDGSRASTGGGAFRIGAIEGDLTVIPEPATHAAIAGGIALLIMMWVRRRRA